MKDLNGENTAANVSHYLEDMGNVRGPLLGLGAGEGIAEIGIARRLRIRDVTLVDRDHEDLTDFEGRYVASDLFQFLGSTRRKYGVVTAFGLEYVLNKPSTWGLLWQGMSNITFPGSVVVISPFEEPFHVDESLFDVKSRRYIFVAQRR